MKISIRAALLAAFVLSALTAPTLRAQTEATRFEMNVPFAFNYGSAHLAAGVYTIDMARPNLLVLHGASRSVMAMTRTEENRSPEKAGRAVFTKYGDRFYLDELWVANSSAHLGIYHAKPKQRIEHVASDAAAPARVELALLSVPDSVSSQ
jgi:hypothetical protein